MDELDQALASFRAFIGRRARTTDDRQAPSATDIRTADLPRDLPEAAAVPGRCASSTFQSSRNVMRTRHEHGPSREGASVLSPTQHGRHIRVTLLIVATAVILGAMVLIVWLK